MNKRKQGDKVSQRRVIRKNMTILTGSGPKLSLTGFLLFLAVSHGAAQPNLQDCAVIDNDIARLQCFDALVDQGNASGTAGRIDAAPDLAETAPAGDEAPAPADRGPVSPAAPAASSEPDGGSSRPSAEGAEDAGEIMQGEYIVASASHSDFTGWTIEFENGQVWRQIGTERYTIREGETYQIEPASLNSYFLGSSGNNRRIRVTRIR